jgi:hypothetical protein
MDRRRKDHVARVKNDRALNAVHDCLLVVIQELSDLKRKIGTEAGEKTSQDGHLAAKLQDVYYHVRVPVDTSIKKKRKNFLRHKGHSVHVDGTQNA